MMAEITCPSWSYLGRSFRRLNNTSNSGHTINFLGGSLAVLRRNIRIMDWAKERNVIDKAMRNSEVLIVEKEYFERAQLE